MVDAKLQLPKVGLSGGDACVGFQRQVKASSLLRIVLAHEITGYIFERIIYSNPSGNGKVAPGQSGRQFDWHFNAGIVAIEFRARPRVVRCPAQITDDFSVAAMRRSIFSIASQRPVCEKIKFQFGRSLGGR